MTKINYQPLTKKDFSAVIMLANDVHGDGYMHPANISTWYDKGIKEGINAGYVAYEENKLIGFRITFAAGNWQIDKWCTPNHWNTPASHVCYFKCNTVDENYRGLGIGSQLLKLSIDAAKRQGATAGVSHLWKQSPGNSAVKYFTKCGGHLIKHHPNKWQEDALNGYNCVLCGFDCNCEAAEMIIYFKD